MHKGEVKGGGVRIMDLINQINLGCSPFPLREPTSRGRSHLLLESLLKVAYILTIYKMRFEVDIFFKFWVFPTHPKINFSLFLAKF